MSSPADTGPAVERLIADTRERSRARLARRERRAHLAFSAAFLVAAVALGRTSTAAG